VNNDMGAPLCGSTFTSPPSNNMGHVKVFNYISHVYGLVCILYDTRLMAIDTISTVMDNTCLICGSDTHVVIGTMYLHSRMNDSIDMPLCLKCGLVYTHDPVMIHTRVGNVFLHLSSLASPLHHIHTAVALPNVVLEHRNEMLSRIGYVQSNHGVLVSHAGSMFDCSITSGLLPDNEEYRIPTLPNRLYICLCRAEFMTSTGIYPLICWLSKPTLIACTGGGLLMIHRLSFSIVNSH